MNIQGAWLLVAVAVFSSGCGGASGGAPAGRAPEVSGGAGEADGEGDGSTQAAPTADGGPGAARDVAVFPFNQQGLALARSGRRAFGVTRDGEPVAFDPTDASIVRRFQRLTSGERAEAAITGDGRYGLVLEEPGRGFPRLYDLESGQERELSDVFENGALCELRAYDRGFLLDRIEWTSPNPTVILLEAPGFEPRSVPLPQTIDMAWAVSPSGRWLAARTASSWDAAIVDLTTGAVARTIEAPAAEIAAAFSPSEALVAISTTRGHVQVTSLADGRVVLLIPPGRGESEHQRLFLTDEALWTRAFDAAALRETPLHGSAVDYPMTSSDVYGVALVEGHVIATTERGLLRWDRATRRLEAAQGIPDRIFSMRVAPGCAAVELDAAGGTTERWDLAAGTLASLTMPSFRSRLGLLEPPDAELDAIAQWLDRVHELSFMDRVTVARERTRVVLERGAQLLELYDAAGARVARIPTDDTSIAPQVTGAVSPDGRELAVMPHHDWRISFHSTSDGAQLRTVTVGANGELEETNERIEAYDGTGRFLVLNHDFRLLVVVNVATGAVEATIPFDQDSPLAVSPTAAELVHIVATEPSPDEFRYELRRVGLPDGRLLSTTTLPSRPEALAWAPDGSAVVLALEDRLQVVPLPAAPRR